MQQAVLAHHRLRILTADSTFAMRPDESPFPLGWYATGPEALWPNPKTFDFVPFGWLPPVPDLPVDPSFAWLPPLALANSGVSWEVDSERTRPPAEYLVELEAAASQLGLQIPADFTQFVLTPPIHQRVPTCTGCYLEFSRSLVLDPTGANGRMLRFLNDSQLSMIWYLYLAPCGDHCVLASGQWHDGDIETTSEALDVSQYFFCAPSFREFLFRFWLENMIWFRIARRAELVPIEADYLRKANKARSDRDPSRTA